jgi:hypothetical protein
VEEPVVAPAPTLSQDLERLSMGQTSGGVGAESTQRMMTMQLYRLASIGRTVSQTLQEDLREDEQTDLRKPRWL